jgi:hypothetical protein
MLLSERLNETIVDVDTSPLLLPTSAIGLVAGQGGYEYDELIEEILQGARLRMYGRQGNRRASPPACPGQDRRFCAVPEAH